VTVAVWFSPRYISYIFFKTFYVLYFWFLQLFLLFYGSQLLGLSGNHEINMMMMMMILVDYISDILDTMYILLHA